MSCHWWRHKWLIKSAINLQAILHWVQVSLLTAIWLSGCLLLWCRVNPLADLPTLLWILHEKSCWECFFIQICGSGGLRIRHNHIPHKRGSPLCLSRKEDWRFPYIYQLVSTTLFSNSSPTAIRFLHSSDARCSQVVPMLTFLIEYVCLVSTHYTARFGRQAHPICRQGNQPIYVGASWSWTQCLLF